MSQAIRARSVSLSVLKEASYHEGIRSLLEDHKLTNEILGKAIELFEQANKERVWTKVDQSSIPLGCSVKTFVYQTTDYKGESTRMIEQAKRALTPSPTSGSELEFKKLSIEEIRLSSPSRKSSFSFNRAPLQETEVTSLKPS